LAFAQGQVEHPLQGGELAVDGAVGSALGLPFGAVGLDVHRSNLRRAAAAE
jgi:hypothetical protein